MSLALNSFSIQSKELSTVEFKEKSIRVISIVQRPELPKYTFFTYDLTIEIKWWGIKIRLYSLADRKYIDIKTRALLKQHLKDNLIDND